MTVVGVEGTTTSAAAEVVEGNEGSGVMVAVALTAGAGGLGAETAASETGSIAFGAVGESGGVVSGTTVSDGRSGSAWTTAMTPSGLRPSNSAF